MIATSVMKELRGLLLYIVENSYLVHVLFQKFRTQLPEMTVCLMLTL